MLNISKGNPWVFWPNSICDTFPENPANKLLTSENNFTINLDFSYKEGNQKQKTIFALLPCYTGLDIHDTFSVFTVSYKKKTEHYTLPGMINPDEKNRLVFKHRIKEGIYLYINDILVLSENLNSHELGFDNNPHIIFGAGNFPRNNFNLNYVDLDLYKFEILVNNNLLAKHDFKDFIFDKSVDITDNCNFIHKI